eukprot:TRINITY_DN623_c0_g1_i1.p1 TRINITY_DN623_c0_g1~~TRINITY_DN623_c0_g1_i1.p1  ORF type:complete len:145 (+),score=26.38 TRINITY_DN623_c0_g1_i1:135-569(+)
MEKEQKNMTKQNNSKTKFLKFQISGFIGTVLFYIFYSFVFDQLSFIENNRAAIAWTISYLSSIIWQHALHRIIVFNDEKMKGSYLWSLGWSYVCYTKSIILSHLMMTLFVDYLKIDYNFAWGITLIITGYINYNSISSIMSSND